MNLLTSYTSLRKERERKREREREESQNIEPFCPCERFHRMLDPCSPDTIDKPGRHTDLWPTLIT